MSNIVLLGLVRFFSDVSTEMVYPIIPLYLVNVFGTKPALVGIIEGIAESLANYKMYYGDTNLINTEIERYMNVTREDIQRVAKKYYNKNNRVVLYYLPKQQQP